MNKKILHVVSSDAVKERVFQLINSSKNEEIVVCPTSLFYGKLPKNQYFVNFQFIDSFIICYVVYTAPLTGTCTPVRKP